MGWIMNTLGQKIDIITYFPMSRCSQIQEFGHICVEPGTLRWGQKGTIRVITEMNIARSAMSFLSSIPETRSRL